MFIFLSKLLPPLVYPLGFALFLILLAVFLYRRVKWQRFFLIVAICLLWIGSTRWISYSIVHSLEYRYLPPPELQPEHTGKVADVIVVLGGGTESQSYPRPTAEVNGAGDRVIYAAYLYHLGKADHLLVCGGSIDWWQKATPAEDMASLLKMLGVPEEAIWKETKSRNTYENALYAREFLDGKGVNNIILVTSAEHMLRSVGLFERQGFTLIPAPTDFSITQENWEALWEPNLATQLSNLLPDAGNLAQLTSALKEYLGYLIYRLRGWL